MSKWAQLFDQTWAFFLGATLENCAYPNSICAVQAALVNAVSNGASQIQALAVTTSSDTVEPCGRCLQFAAEFGVYPVHMLVGKDHIQTWSLPDLLRPTMKIPRTQFMSGRRNLINFSKNNEFSIRPGADTAGLEQAVFEQLVGSAVAACQHCYAPASDFPVGAALLTDKRQIVMGANIECHCLGIGLCAERTAMCNMVSNDAGRPVALAVVCAKLPDFGRPCGGCRQNLVEFGEYPVFQLRLDWENKTIEVLTTSTLHQLPGAFTPTGFGASFN
eukprot:Gregarina_sp_Pseudo_9__15@NODE_1010_length_1970_cov_97_988089_g947_i0_p1_GENE_NODE_1010_length_1970_cov_97_988089_g947_i0NODE_1010_length_1970_cov_97_988089_g947_i0_p1_ORF_typecomplete_len275_score23_30dCMP_cyt_deam_2/PF08211_12/5e07dCMP_cyt_deam_2/PF08211_12/6e16dCMP_cyt_deam_1/PF00383_23/1_9e07dCMP_cyt_deam_1/PF00383_23/2_2e11_NODE_1010_length_1970_cov_97_988089_g947_i0164988